MAVGRKCLQTVQTEYVLATNSLIVVEDYELAAGAWIWIDSPHGTRRNNRVLENLDARAIELYFTAGFDFVAGDFVVHPLFHLYDPRIESISYGDAQDQDHLLKSSTITYTVKLQRPRRK